ncbi:MAG TPA: flagellar hook-basal body complex protein FliE [Bacillus sp. (in: firmicutes)]|nr:flagellar hook-basal body complex protein FliE [Bacillus sp. (in: firmicutes)]
MIQSVMNNSQAASISTSNVKPAATVNETVQSFSSFFKQSINELNQSQAASDAAAEKLVKGEPIDLHQVMIASQKASIMLQTAIEVRNKAIEAYQETMRMQV